MKTFLKLKLSKWWEIVDFPETNGVFMRQHLKKKTLLINNFNLSDFLHNNTEVYFCRKPEYYSKLDSKLFLLMDSSKLKLSSESAIRLETSELVNFYFQQIPRPSFWKKIILKDVWINKGLDPFSLDILKQYVLFCYE